jgi:fumarate hydratase subunit alpha
MRELPVLEITECVARLCVEANVELGDDMLDAFRRAQDTEDSPVGREILGRLLENASVAKNERLPICQDTGLVVVFLDVGQDVHLVGGDLKSAVHEGVRRGYTEGYLRKSSSHPLTRINTGDNTPAIIYVDLVPGEQVKVTVVPKGGGSENMSRLFMLLPSAGKQGVGEKVLEVVREAGPNPCPPTIVGIGIGGTFEQAAFQAKKALIRPVGEPNPDPELARWEQELLSKINCLGLGPQGLGGRTTSLAVHIRVVPCHIASFPVAINLQCHANRHKHVIL